MKIKKTVSALLALLILLPLIAVPFSGAAALRYKFYEYEMYAEDSVIITEYIDGGAVNLVIPSELEGYRVEAIGERAFENAYAETITIPDTVRYIGDYAFNNVRITSVEIPASVEYIGVSAFKGDNFSDFFVSPHNKNYSSKDGYLLSKDGSVIIAYPNGREETDLIIPEGIKYIHKGTFSHSDKITSVVFPKSLTGIEEEAFAECTKLESVVIPEGVEYIGHHAFYKCKKLIDIDVTGCIKGLARYAFEDTAWEEKPVWGGRYLGDMLHYYRYTGTYAELEIKEGIRMICDEALSGSGPVKLVIPASVEYISPTAFKDSPLNLSEIYVHQDNKYYSSENDMLFNKDKTVLYFGTIGCNPEELPSTVVEIGPYAYNESSHLQEIIIPDTVRRIDEYAFDYCYYARKIVIPESVEYLGHKAFDRCGFVNEIIFPQGSTMFSVEDFEGTQWYNWAKEGNLILNGTYMGYKGEVADAVVPDETESVAKKAFYGSETLKSVVLPESLKAVGTMAFENCPLLTEVTIPAGVEKIEDYAFGYTYVCNDSGEEGEHFPVEGFVIKGYSNSQAEAYAIENGFEFVAIGEIEVSKLLGDTDLDEVVTIKDATAIQKYLASLQLFVTQQKINADINGDSEVNIKDATAIQKQIAGLAY